MKENFRAQSDWASLIVGRKFTVFALFYFVFEGNFPSTSSRRGGGAYIWRGDLTEGKITEHKRYTNLDQLISDYQVSYHVMLYTLG